jgi:predicted phage-related endonuclease
MRDDFSPEIRNAAIWSGDSRQIAKGNATGVVLEKLGRIDRPDMDKELARMGHIMQPVIARIFEDEHDCRLVDLDVPLTHPKHDWLRSHFDYQELDAKFLVECKNYNAAYASYFSEPGDPIRIPDDDYAQCLHEALVHGTDTVWLAVLFGGQRYRDFKLVFTDEDKQKWLEKLAWVWGCIGAQNPPAPASPDQAREIWPFDDTHTVIATKGVEALCAQLARYKEQHKQNETAIEAMQTQVMNFMGTRAVLSGIDGRTLATWKTAKTSSRFNADLLKASAPEIYDAYCVETVGSRRFLLKA